MDTITISIIASSISLIGTFFTDLFVYLDKYIEKKKFVSKYCCWSIDMEIRNFQLNENFKISHLNFVKFYFRIKKIYKKQYGRKADCLMWFLKRGQLLKEGMLVKTQY